MNIIEKTSDKNFSSVREIIEKLRPEVPIYCLSRKIIEENARKFIEGFPGKVLYAVKCNPHVDVLDSCAASGVTNFDVASLGEAQLIYRRYRNAGIYFQHPVKSRTAIRSSYELCGVRNFAVDHSAELSKISEEINGTSQITIFVRLATPPGGAREHLSDKFGASIKSAGDLLSKIYEKGYKPAISFHVGSQCYDPNAYLIALSMVGDLLEQSKVKITALDVGGGFPANYPKMSTAPLESYLAPIRNGIASLNLLDDVDILCEPGRALVANGMSIITQVHLRRERSLYINDGIFGSFAETSLNKFELSAEVLRLNNDPSQELLPFTIYGPTCDSHDQIPMVVNLSSDVKEGDWVVFFNVGAYSNAMRTTFNGFDSEIFVNLVEN